MVREWLLIGIALLGLTTGCQSTSFKLDMTPPPPVFTDQPSYRVLQTKPLAEFDLQLGKLSSHWECMTTLTEYTGKDIDIEVSGISRGCRGGMLHLAITNKHPNETLVLDWDKIKARLESGQYRQPFDGQDLDHLRQQFGADAYGIPDQRFRDWTIPGRKELLRIDPGTTMTCSFLFGALPEENSLLLSFEGAIQWEITELNPPHLQGDGRCPILAITLPPMRPPLVGPSWWPEGLHFGFVATNGG